MPTPTEDDPNYPVWRKAVERVIAARKTLDRAEIGTPEREAARQEHRAAHAAYMLIAQQISPWRDWRYLGRISSCD
jgi:hypothetical protein